MTFTGVSPYSNDRRVHEKEEEQKEEEKRGKRGQIIAQDPAECYKTNEEKTRAQQNRME